MDYYTYMLRCSDQTIYTGITNDIEKRLKEHKNKKGAKYTKSHDVIKLEVAWKSNTKSLACKLEYHIKKLKKNQKEELIINKKLEKYLKNKVNCDEYKVI